VAFTAYNSAFYSGFIQAWHARWCADKEDTEILRGQKQYIDATGRTVVTTTAIAMNSDDEQDSEASDSDADLHTPLGVLAMHGTGQNDAAVHEPANVSGTSGTQLPAGKAARKAAAVCSLLLACCCISCAMYGSASPLYEEGVFALPSSPL
jgi:hypothetical protein